jgi:predicted secreted hydrolase
VSPPFNRPRRHWLASALAGALPGPTAAQPRSVLTPGHWAAVVEGQVPVFPRDYGAHPDYRTEWWYLTGWVEGSGGAPTGIQVTFFRRRTLHDPRNPSRFSPAQLLFAHAAIASPARRRLLHAERSSRSGFGLAEFATDDLDVRIGNWSMRREPSDRILTDIESPEFGLSLRVTPPGAPHLQGLSGFSRKGPGPGQASWYYSRPQLRIDGTLRDALNRSPVRVSGRGWLDHEWSTEILDEAAVGWDWTGINLDDGSALMAFRMRRRDGSTLWSDARWIDASAVRSNAPTSGHHANLPYASDPRTQHGPEFIALRNWISPRTGASWPVSMRVRHAGRELVLRPLLDDQEIDATASTGTVYWEGAVTVLENDTAIGRGYLELTGYARPLRL